ncbi:MAG: hypothetical protein ABSG53_13945 [Thermoguttaceae bacterium]
MNRFPVHGTVTLASGEKLNGSISFLPAKGPAATTALKEGSYKFDRNNGPVAGPQTVIVTRVFPRSSVMESPPDNKAVPGTKAKWNQSTDISDDGQYVHDFTLED